MANELNITSPSGSTIYAVIRKVSDHTVWQTTTSTFVAWDNANIANYDVALTDRSGDYYSADFPSGIASTAGPFVVTYYLQAIGTPAITDTPLDSETMFGSTAPAASGPVGGGTTTVGTLVTIARVTLRNAGIADASDTNYDLTSKHIGIQLLLKDFVRRTKCITSIDTFTITSGDDDVDLSGITGFHTERIRSVWIDGEDSPIDVTSIEDINSWLANNSSTGMPNRIGFSVTTGVGKVFPTPDAAYTGKVRWWEPLTAWTFGDTGVAALELNVPGDLAENAIEKGIIWQLQRNQPEHAAIVAASKQDYEQYVARNMGAGNLGVQSVQVRPSDFRTSRWGM